MDKAQNIALLIGRILMSWIFVTGGWGKLLAATATQAAFGQRYGLPLPVIAWLVAVVVELGGGLALLVGLYTRFVGIVLAIWCVVTALVAHTNFADRMQEINFHKNIAMAGGFLFVFAVGAGVYSFDRIRLRYR